MERLSEHTERMRRNEAHGEFLRFIQLLAKSGGDALAAHQGAVNARLERAAKILKAAVAAGTTTAAAWMDDVAGYRALTAEWMSLLSSRTLLGRLPFRRVDFNTRTLQENSPGSAAWVAEGVAIPLSKFSMDAAQLDISKIAGLIVLTRESVESATQASLANLNRSMLNVIGRYSDVALLDPTIAAVTAKNPASLTNAGTNIPGTGSTEAAITAVLKALLEVHVDAGADLATVQFVMHPASALYLATLLTAGNVRAFPNIGVRGGEIFGVPVMTTVGAVAPGSPSERIIAAINPEGVLVADDGDAFFAATRSGALQMDDAPTNSTATPTATNLVSLFQAHSVALRFTRWVNWKTMTGAVSYARVTW